MKRDYDTRISTNTYAEGDLVYALDSTRKIGRCKKIDPNIWQGPFIIVKKYSDLLFRVKGKPGSKERVVHHDRLKPYNSKSIPDWANLGQYDTNSKLSKQHQLSQKNQKHVKSNKSKVNNPPEAIKRSTRTQKQTKLFQSGWSV